MEGEAVIPSNNVSTWLFAWVHPTTSEQGSITFTAMPLERAEALWLKAHRNVFAYAVYELNKKVTR